MEDTCDWANLISTVEDNDRKRNISARIKNLCGDNIELGDIINKRLHKFNLSYSIEYEKTRIKVSDLSLKAYQVYTYILKECPTDNDLYEIQNFINNGSALFKRSSGRTIDTLMTRFQRYHNVCYYLDVTDPKHPIMCDKYEEGKNMILFDIGASYRQKMHQFSKTYFDCFGRGYEVEHHLNNNQIMYISLCKFTFFIWARRFLVFKFLQKHLHKVIIVRQYSQKNLYKPKKKKIRKPRLPLRKTIKKVMCVPHIDIKMYTRQSSKRRRLITTQWESPNLSTQVKKFDNRRKICK